MVKEKHAVQELLDHMSEANRKAWERWLSITRDEAVNDAGVQMEEQWTAMLDAGQQSVEEALKVQGQLVEAYQHMFEGAPQPISDLMDNFCGQWEKWIEARGGMWTAWFDSLREIELKTPVAQWVHGVADIGNPWTAWFDIARGQTEKASGREGQKESTTARQGRKESAQPKAGTEAKASG